MKQEIYSREELRLFEEAIQTMKLYRRAELQNPQGEDLIEKLYVDPLPDDYVHRALVRTNSTFLIGRKGTGKSTVFLRAQKSLLKNRRALSSYVDIKTVYEAAQPDAAALSRLNAYSDALSPEAAESLLLMTSFIKAVVQGIRDDIRDQLKASWARQLQEFFTGSVDDLFERLDTYIASIANPDFTNVQAIRAVKHKDAQASANATTIHTGGKFSANPELSAGLNVEGSESNHAEIEYSTLLLRAINVQDLITRLEGILTPLGVKHLYIFVDDFSELPKEAMQVIVNTLIAPLNNRSNELIKFKIAAYPSRIYYGEIDKSKIDEIDLDIHSLYGSGTVADMEQKGIDFTRRMVEQRLKYFNLEPTKFFGGRGSSRATRDQIWHALFNASVGNPRTLGYILLFLYEDRLLYDQPIGLKNIRDAAQRYFEQKIEPYFQMGRFLHEAFEERSSIYSLKELLEAFIQRARELRSRDKASIFKRVEGQHPTSHFNISIDLEPILSTLELNFFITKYFVMSNRDGQRVAVYALNYGLCEKFSIEYGRPTTYAEVDRRPLRLYLVERVFDFNPLIQAYLAANQEIRCDTCGALHEVEDLDMLRKFRMLCPECMEGTCRVTNISRKYADLLASVREEELLPATELGILQTLDSQGDGLNASDIAGELDVSYQLIGRRAKHLDERSLLQRSSGAGGRREYRLSDDAKAIYFSDEDSVELDVESNEDSWDADEPH